MIGEASLKGGKIMARTESKSMQVHPNEEQKLIELMQKFHWSLLRSQEVKMGNKENS